MLGKKLIGVLMAASLTLSVAIPNKIVQAKPADLANASFKNYIYSFGGYHAAAANEEKIIEMLKKEGKIPQNATQEEIKNILKDYLKQNDPSDNYKPTKQQKDLQEKIKNKAEAYGLKQDKKVSQVKGEPQYVQTEEWSNGSQVARPLVVLVQYSDYKFTDITPYDTDMYYEDYSKEHYEKMLFNDGTYKGPNGEDFITMRQWYMEQSGGSYAVDGGIAGIYTAKNTLKYYGEDVNGERGDDAHARDLVKEAFDAACADVSLDLSKYDIEDRYDLDNDGNYNEPDGVIDHFVVVHAGPDQANGGGTIGSDTIWSHRWNLNGDYEVKAHDGKTYAVNDYTMDPQDGAPGVFAHEYAHDLGLPDEYDTQYTGDGEPVGAWSIMSGGSNSGAISGTEPTGFSPWCKQVLQANYGGNWLKGSTVNLNDITESGADFLIDQASTKGTNNDVVRIDLPAKESKLFTPASGTYVYFSGSKSNLDTSMTATVDLTGKTSAQLKFKTWYDIEEDYDYVYVEAKEEGKEWTLVVGGELTGTSQQWEDMNFDLSAYKGKKIDIRFNYQSDSGVNGEGFFIDDIEVEADGQSLLKDGAEGAESFILDGFEKHDGIKRSEHYYLIEWRNHQGVDTALAHGWASVSYDPGLIIWYADGQYSDNFTGIHPGEGYIGVVDADQTTTMWKYDDASIPDEVAYAEINLHDVAFSLRKSEVTGFRSNYWGRTGLDTNTFMHPYFDDGKNYLNLGQPSIGRNVPNYGLKVYVTGESKDRSVAKIHISRISK